MKNRFVVAVVIVVGVLSLLIYTAVTATAKSVVTVHELLEKGAVGSVRLGARVAEGEISQRSEPTRQVSFYVKIGVLKCLTMDFCRIPLKLVAMSFSKERMRRENLWRRILSLSVLPNMSHQPQALTARIPDRPTEKSHD